MAGSSVEKGAESGAAMDAAMGDERGDGGGVAGEQDLTVCSRHNVVPAGGLDMDIPVPPVSSATLLFPNPNSGILAF
jgi:hypothetical protein